MNKPLLFVRGTTVDAARRYMERSMGTNAWKAFEDKLTPDQHKLFQEPVRRRDWYEMELYSTAIDIGAQTIGAENPQSYLEGLGRFVMDDGVNSLYKAFFRIASPSFVLRGSALLWGMFFKGSKLKVENRGKRFVTTAIHGAPFCQPSLCSSIGGGMLSALEHAGATNVRLETHQCRSTGGDRCSFSFQWN